MKLGIYICALGLLLPLGAQIEIDLVEALTEELPQSVGVPDAVDHSRPGKSGPEHDVLQFLNGDRLSGELIGIDAEEGLRWKHPDAEEELSFRLDNLKNLTFRDSGEAEEELLSLPRIELTNGDQYRGRILAMDAETLTLESPLGGRMNIQSTMVRSFRPRVESSMLFSGPNSLEEWTQNQRGGNGWEFKREAMYSNQHNQIAGIKIEDLPDRVAVEMLVEWKGNVNMQIGFWGQDLNNINQNCYTLWIQNGYLRCYRNYDKIGRNDLGNAQVRDEMSDGQLEVRLLLNREKKEVTVLFDGSLVARWNDSFDGRIVGDGLLLGSMGNSPTRVSRIRVRKWDGEFDLEAPEKPGDLDELITNNGDMFAGKVLKISSGLLYFQNEFAEFQVPLERIEELTLARNTRSTPRLQTGDVEIMFPNKERITLQLKKLDSASFLGFSEATGEVKLRRNYFSALKLNPYDERHLEEEEDW